MREIWKFPLEIVDTQKIQMPAGATTLCVKMQEGIPCLWALVAPGNKMVKRMLITHGTGHPVPETTGDYIDTYLIEDKGLVFHVFEQA